jgi:hypothetical protein
MRSRSFWLAVITASTLVSRPLWADSWAETWSANQASGSWEVPANWTANAVPSASDQVAVFGDSVGWHPFTITLNQPETVNSLSFVATEGGSYNLTGSPLTFAGSQPYISVGLSNVNTDIISAPVVLNSNVVLDDAVGTLNLSGGISGSGQILKFGSGTLVLSSPDTDTGDAMIFSGQVTLTPAGTFQAAMITLETGSELYVAGSSATTTVQHIGTIQLMGGTAVFGSTSSRTVVVTPSVVSAPGSSLDLKSNSLDLSSESLTAANAQVAAGYNLAGGANWQGSGGITSSNAAANSSHLTALGVVQNNQGGSPLFTATNMFGGTTPNPGDVLVKYTWFGDANLDGKVDGSDYSLIDAGYASGGQLTGWYNGDFNYDGTIDGSDYALIDNAYNNQGSPIKSSAMVAVSTAQVAASSATVPEPAAASLVIAVAIASRRRPVQRS